MAKIKKKTADGIAFYVRQGSLDKKSLKELTKAIVNVMETIVCEGSPEAEAQVKVQALISLSTLQTAQPVNINAGSVKVR